MTISKSTLGRLENRTTELERRLYPVSLIAEISKDGILIQDGKPIEPELWLRMRSESFRTQVPIEIFYFNGPYDVTIAGERFVVKEGSPHFNLVLVDPPSEWNVE